MARASVYTMEGFVQDVRQVFASSKDPRHQAEKAAGHMKYLLAVPGWLEEKINLPEEGGYGRADLHLDDDYGHPGPGFLLMCSIQRPGQDNLPHDHGASWVVYGVYKGAIEQTKWRWTYGESEWTSPELKPAERLVQKDGDVAVFLPGEIHTTKNLLEGRSLVVRLEGQILERVVRHRYDHVANTAGVHSSG